MKKILYLVTKSDLSGAPIQVFSLVNKFKDKYKIVFVTGKKNQIFFKLNELNIKTYSIESLESSLSFIKLVKSFFVFIKIVRSESPDLIHCHSAISGIIARLVSFVLNIPCIYTVHGFGFGFGRPLLRSSITYCTELLFNPLTKFYITVSNADMRLGKFLLIPKKKIITIFNGVDDLLNLETKNTKFVMVARVSKQKDHETLIKGMNNIKNKLHLIGSGTDDDNFKLFCKSLNENYFQNIFFHGEISNPRKILLKYDVFILSSNYEGLPISIIEAMAANMIIVASDVEGNNELIDHGINGYLFKRGNDEELNKILHFILKNKDKVKLIADQARYDYLNKYNSDIFFRKTGNIYKNFLN